MLEEQCLRQMQTRLHLPIQYICKCITTSHTSICRTTNLHNRKSFGARVSHYTDSAADQRLETLRYPNAPLSKRWTVTLSVFQATHHAKPMNLEPWFDQPQCGCFTHECNFCLNIPCTVLNHFISSWACNVNSNFIVSMLCPAHLSSLMGTSRQPESTKDSSMIRPCYCPYRAALHFVTAWLT